MRPLLGYGRVEYALREARVQVREIHLGFGASSRNAGGRQRGRAALRGSMLYAHRHPELLERLVLVDITPGLPAAAAPGEVSDDDRTAPREFDSHEAALAHLKRLMPHAPAPLRIRELDDVVGISAHRDRPFRHRDRRFRRIVTAGLRP